MLQKKDLNIMNGKIINDEGLDILFRTARTYSYFQNKEVSDVLIEAIYDLAKMGATSMNSNPARFLFVKSPEAKEKLLPYLFAGNKEKAMSAPVTVIVAHDLEFYEHLPNLVLHTDARAHFIGKDDYIHDTAYRNGTLQGAYMMMAARALGLDCGAMSGFDHDGVKKEFFGDQNVEVNFLCNLGYGDTSQLHERGPRLKFSDACKIL